jgi:type II secretory pathway component GspD/PulD (secretin)
MNPRWRQTAIVALTWALGHMPAWAADTPAGSGDGTPADVPREAIAAAADTVTLNLVNADIETVAKAVSEITGRNLRP